MTHFTKFSAITIIVAGSALCTLSCKKVTLPVINTSNITGITQTGATSGGNIKGDGGAEVTARGICWGTIENPTTSSSKTSDGKGTGVFVSVIAELTPGTKYFVRAYATNSEGTAYGNEISFLSDPVIPATLTTTNVTSITASTAITGGNITSDGAGPITSRGVCWSTTSTPTVSQNKTTDGSGTGTFVSNISGLLPATKYYVRSYAVNSAGTSYGNEIFFSSNPDLPGLTTTVLSSITAFSARSGGNITSDGGAEVSTRGICWSTSPNPTTINDKISNGTGAGVFTCDINNLNPNTSYYVRAYATNSAGTSYGNQQNFATKDGTSMLTTNNLTEIKTNSGISGGNITDDGGSPITVRGVCWSNNTEPTIVNYKTTDGSGTGTFSSNITNLQPNTTYYVRAYATNVIKTSYGIQQTFKTKDGTAMLTTTTTLSIMAKSATGGGSITDDGGSGVIERGICWSKAPDPTTSGSKVSAGSGTGIFTANLTSLEPGTVYYARAYAVNFFGTWYGNDDSFTTFAAEDIDGNVYNSVTIGTQVWLKENLKTTKFNNGQEILPVPDKTDWENLTTPGYCWYNNDAVTYKSTYGALYNWFAVNNGNLCPSGWHLPTDLEWTALTNSLGGENIAGGKLKEEGTGHWSSPNTGATNETKFTALPGGCRNYAGGFIVLGGWGWWWSSTEASSTLAWVRRMTYNYNWVDRSGYSKNCGMSIRCVKN
jgi:uncharacterized protein (TIGR02145 family)